MKYKKKDIKSEYWVQLGNKPMHNGKTLDNWLKYLVEQDNLLLSKPAYKRYLSAYDIKRRIKNHSKQYWFKVLSTRDGFRYRDSIGLSAPFYVKWVTNVAKSYKETKEV